MDEAVKTKNRKSKSVPRRNEKRRVPRKYLYLPELQRTRPGTETIGYICRAVTAWLAVWGLLLFVNDSFRFEVDTGFLALASILSVAVLTAAQVNWLGGLIALGSASVSAAVFVRNTDNPVKFAYASVISVYNGICGRLSDLGYRSPGEISVDFSTVLPGFENTDFLAAGMAFIGILLAVIIALSAVKRVRMLPITVAGGVICVFIFTYNLSGRSWGFTLMLTALCGLIVMRAYEVFFREAPEPKPKRGKKLSPKTPAITEPPVRETETLSASADNEKPRAVFGGGSKGSALGGFAGLAAMVLAFIVLLFPTLSINKKWEEIEAINTKMEIARQLVSSVIIGDTPDFSDLGYLGQMDLLTSRSTTASERVFTGAKVMEVRSNYGLPVYVRSFVSKTYDNDKWYVPQSYDISYFYKTFGDNFSGEEISRNFYNIIDPKLTQLNNYDNYVSRIEYGYVTTPVDISLISSSGNLLFLPSRYDPTVGLLSYGGSAENAYEEEYVGYSDGIVSTSWLNFNKSYRALTYVQSYRHEDVFTNLALLDSYYTLCRNYIESSIANPDADYTEQARSDIASLGLDDLADNNIYDRWYGSDEAGREQIYNLYLLADKYNSYVDENYLSVTDSEFIILQSLAAVALSSAYPDLNITYLTSDDGNSVIDTTTLPSSLTVYEKVMAVINYLKDNYTYTLSPKEPKSTKLSSVDAFLLDTKQGYCVQFATAAALMLRTLGIPTRYCEGYIAAEFKLDKSTSGEGRYSSLVLDNNAHAWIEVYIDNLGWMTFETTPEYYSGMYEHYSLSSDYLSSNYETLEYTPPDDLEEDSANASNKLDVAGLIAVIAAGLAATGALGAAVYFIWRFASASRQALYKRDDFIGRALRHELEGDERRSTAVAVADYITGAFSVAGLRPMIGELPTEYADRCGRVLRGEESAKPAKNDTSKLKRPHAIAALIPKNKPKTVHRTKTAKPVKQRSGSLGIADEFTAPKGEYKPEPAAETAAELARGCGDIVGFIQREEFGDGMAPSELRSCAEFLVGLSDEIYRKLNPLSRFWFRHVKHFI